jgi:tetratricopeptide (TPR) repeat protein
MRAMLRIVVFCIGLMIVLPTARADVYEDCVQEQDRDRAILGCTEIITKGHEIEQDDLALAYYNRGLAYNQKGDPDRAIADFNKVIELNPNFAPAYGARGSAYETKGDPDRAIADYRKATELGFAPSKERLKQLGASP